MNDRWLKTFIEAADLGSFSKVAEKQFVTTTAILQQIRLLEKEIGFPVLTRSNHGVQLSEAGVYFYEVARKILDLYEDGIQRGQEIYTKVPEVVTVAYTPNEFPGFIMLALSRLGREMSFQTRLLAMGFNEQIEAVNSGRADMCISAQPHEEFIRNCVFLPLYDDCFAFAMGHAHPFAQKDRITLEDLPNLRLVSGYYPFVKNCTDYNLSDYAPVEYLESEQDLDARMKIATEDKVMVISCRWEDQYSGLLKVVYSDIPSGTFGIVCNKKVQTQVKRIYQRMKREFDS